MRIYCRIMNSLFGGFASRKLDIVSRGVGRRPESRTSVIACTADARVLELMTTMDKRDILNPSWWQSLGAISASSVLSKVVSVSEGGDGVSQSNSSVEPYTLVLADDQEYHVALKVIDLDQNRYRDEQHKRRSAKSYAVESAFYTQHAAALTSSGVCVPQCHATAWNSTGTQGLVILENLSKTLPLPAGHSGRAEHGRSPHQRLALNFDEAAAALAWIARFHAHFWRADDSCAAGPDVWPLGSYWSLDKRTSDLVKMEAEWDKWLSNMAANFPAETSDPSIRSLAHQLRDLAPHLANLLTFHKAEYGSTWLHGDFKTANIFFADGPAADEAGSKAACTSLAVCACDFQWVGAGIGMQDVVYLIWTSVDPAVVKRSEAALVKVYCDTLRSCLGAVNGAAPASVSRPVMAEQYEVAFLDYVRYLVGGMWGACTPELFQQRRDDINQGMHKRDVHHHMAMVRRAATLVQGRYSLLRPFDAREQEMWSSMPLALRVGAATVHVVDYAGAVVRAWMGADAESFATMKGVDDPQTQADLSAERLILARLRSAFPSIALCSEEGQTVTCADNADVRRAALDNPCYRHVLHAVHAAWQQGRIADCTAQAADSDVAVWIDPLDGTRELLTNNQEAVTVLAGVAVCGEPFFGSIHQVFVDNSQDHKWGEVRETDNDVLDTSRLEQASNALAGASSDTSALGCTWWGAPGVGVWRNEAQWQPVAAETCVVAHTRRKPSAALMDVLCKLAPDETVKEGGAGCKAVLILTGKCSHWVMVGPGTKRWDTCAPEAILRASGGFLLDSSGAAYAYKSDVDPSNAMGVMAGGSIAAKQRLASTLKWL